MSGRRTRSQTKKSAQPTVSGISNPKEACSKTPQRHDSEEDIFAEEVNPSSSISSATPVSATCEGAKSVSKASSSKRTSKKTVKKNISKQPKKVTKSRRKKGLKAATDVGKHILPDEIYKECVEPVVTITHPDSDTTPVHSSGEVPQTGSQSNKPPAHTCSKCSKGFATKHGFQKHLMTHGIEDANSRRPSADVLIPEIDTLVIESLEEIKLEYGEEKKKYVECILKAAATRPNDWCHFIENFSEPFLMDLSNPTKIMPSNQYEENLVNLNKMLNDRESYNSLLDNLKFLTSDVESVEHSVSPSSPIPGMVVFRLTTKFLNKLAELIYSSMLKHQPEQDTAGYAINDDVERRAFVLHLRKLLQDIYMKGLRLGSKVWLSRCACIRQCFVDTLDECTEQEMIEMICHDDSWIENKEGEIKLKLSDRVVKFFLEVEEIIDFVIHDKTVETNSDAIVNIMLRPEKSDVLDLWHSLTVGHFSEVESLVFLRDIIIVLVSLSLRLEEGRMRGEIVRGRAPKYALRSDLQRN